MFERPILNGQCSDSTPSVSSKCGINLWCIQFTKILFERFLRHTTFTCLKNRMRYKRYLVIESPCGDLSSLVKCCSVIV